MSRKKARAGRPQRRGSNGSFRIELRRGGAEFDDGGGPGPAMTREVNEAIIAAMDRFDPDRPWTEARSDVRPMLPRFRPFPFPIDPIRTMLPPGILTGFGIDLGPALTMIDAGLLERWRVDLPTVVGAALENVRAIAAAADPATVVRESVAGVPVLALQTGAGVAAALLLVPDEIERFFGPRPQLLLAPMRDLLIGLPADVDPGFASWLAEEWESLDPNHLHLGGWLLDGGAIHAVPLDEAFATA